ncbi:MAG TPA: beta-ketoacyl synthase N-terminal-like domain-containing protein, partial [Bacillota bacterium]|nr:beta-ketoacyl synthase N-terminal-like domain-containing protein [Bacillota bacterium]
MQRQNRVVITGMGLFHSPEAGYIKLDDQELQDLLPGINFRSVNRQSIFAGIAARRAIATYLEEAGFQPEQTGVVMGSTFGAVTSIGEFYRKALGEGVNAVSPMEFPNTVANAPASRVGIWLKLKGPSISLSDGLISGLNAVGYAYDEIRYQKAE